jgi:hypothetical protein
MTTLTGNNDHPSQPTTGTPGTDSRLPGRPNGSPYTGVPDLVYPNLRWGDDEYAALQGRLDMYSDFIVLSKYRAGQATEQYVVDPTELAAAITDLDLNSGLLPRDCLFWGKQQGTDRLAVYLPPQVWPVVVRGAPSTGSPSTSPSTSSGGTSGPAWRVPLPGLIFIGHQYDYALWAVTERPADTGAPLYLAPCPNVSLQGVCRGNAPFPKAGPTTIWQAVEVFFASKFNPDLSNGKSQAYPDNILRQWQALHAAGADTYPLADLVPVPFTLRRLLHV